MTALFSQIWHAGLTAGFVVLAVLLLRLCFRKAPKWITVALWGLVAVRLLVPATVTSPVSVVPTLPEAVTFEAPAQTVPEDIMSASVAETVPSETADEPPVTIPATPHVTVSLETAAAVVWVGGIVAMVTYAVVTTAKLRHRVRTATKLKGRIFESDAVTSPFILGVFNPKVYLPYGLDGALKDSVIAHETAHLKRFDHLIKPLGFLLLSVYWFQPLLWVAYVCLCRDIEAACDEKAIRTLDDAARKTYSYALVTLGVKDRRRIAACPLAFGEVGVKERVKRVMSYKKPTVWILTAAIVLSSVAAVCLLTDRAPKGGGATLEGAKLAVDVKTTINNNHEEPLVEGASFTVRDHTPTPNKITVLSVNERELTVKVGFERELYLDGKLTDTVELSYDETVSLTAPMYKEKTCSYLVSVHALRTDEWMDVPSAIGGEQEEFGRYDVTQYSMGEVTLRLFDFGEADSPWFVMTYGEQHDYMTVGSFEDADETLVLTEDACLTRQVFRRQADGSLVYDAKASYRHKKAKALELKNGDELGFDFEYDVSESGSGNATRYDYAIKKADGTAWIEKTKQKRTPTISFTEDDVLCVMMNNGATIGRYEAQQYIDLTTGEVSPLYNAVVCSDADTIAELVKNEQGEWGIRVSQFATGTYATPAYAAPAEKTAFFSLKSVSDAANASVNVRIDGEKVYFAYFDDGGKEHIEAYTWATREKVSQALIVLLRDVPTVYFSHPFSADTADMYHIEEDEPFAIYTEDTQEPRKVYTVGSIRAAVYVDGEYVDLQDALESGCITIDKLRDNLRRDAENGITGSQSFRDGGTTVYFYGDSEFDNVTAMNKLEGSHDVYIGEYEY